MMLPANITGNFDRVKQVAFSNLPIEEKMHLFDEFDDLMVFYKDNIKFVKNCFLPIDGFEDYAVNPFGDVISKKGDFVKLLSKCYNGGGYLIVGLFRDGKRYSKRVHRLVADTFLANTDQMSQVNHIDGDKEDNRLDNLEYCTALENIQHAYKTGLYSKRGRLTEDELDQIVELLNAGVIYKEIADRFNISPTHVYQIATGRRHRELLSKIDIPEKVIRHRQERIKCLENGKTYDSQTEAALDLNIAGSNISTHLKGKLSHVGGYHFTRVNEKEN